MNRICYTKFQEIFLELHIKNQYSVNNGYLWWVRKMKGNRKTTIKFEIEYSIFRCECHVMQLLFLLCYSFYSFGTNGYLTFIALSSLCLLLILFIKWYPLVVGRRIGTHLLFILSESESNDAFSIESGYFWWSTINFYGTILLTAESTTISKHFIALLHSQHTQKSYKLLSQPLNASKWCLSVAALPIGSVIAVGKLSPWKLHNWIERDICNNSLNAHSMKPHKILSLNAELIVALWRILNYP